MNKDVKIIEVKSDKEFIYYDNIDDNNARVTYSIKGLTFENIKNLKEALDNILTGKYKEIIGNAGGNPNYEITSRWLK